MARQQLVNGEPYLDHRTKINEMFQEAYSIEGAIRFVSESFQGISNGSYIAPYALLQDAIDDLNPAAGASVIQLGAGNYFVSGILNETIVNNISWINSGGRFDVIVAGNNIINSGIDATFEKITFSDSFAISAASSIGVVDFRECTFNSDLLLLAMEGSSFVLQNSVISNSLAHFAGQFILLDSSALDGGSDSQLLIDNAVDTDTRLKGTNCVFSSTATSDAIVIKAENDRTTFVEFLNCDFILPNDSIQLIVEGDGQLSFKLDIYSYDHMLRAGADFQQPGITVDIVSVAIYRFADVPLVGSIPNSPTAIQRLTETNLLDGLYEIKVMFAYGNTTGRVAWQVTGDYTGRRFGSPSTIINEDVQVAYIIPVTITGGTFDIELIAETVATGTAQIYEATLIIERKEPLIGNA